MILQCVSLLLPVAATCGWYCGRKERQQITRRETLKLRKDYFRGLNYMIHDQPDKAVDVFIQLLEVDSETVETHLALGGLFRRRGEVDRAIRVHQNLIARPQLAQEYKLAAMLALAQDYFSAGVLDRSEKIFLKLVRYGYEEKIVLSSLIRIYQQEKAWSKAIQIARKFECKVGLSMSRDISHFYCEIALEHIITQSFDDAKRYLKQAFITDSKNARSSILLARIACMNVLFDQAIKHYQHALEIEPGVAPLVLDDLYQCYQAKGLESEFMTFVIDDLKDKRYLTELPDTAVRRYLFSSPALDRALINQLQEQVDLASLEYVLTSYLTRNVSLSCEHENLISKWIHILNKRTPQYQCCQCGFKANMKIWVCPSCHAWSTIKTSVLKEE